VGFDFVAAIGGLVEVDIGALRGHSEMRWQVYLAVCSAVLSTVPAVDGKFPSPAVPGGDRPTSIDDLRVIIHNRYSVIISTFLHYLD